MSRQTRVTPQACARWPGADEVARCPSLSAPSNERPRHELLKNAVAVVGLRASALALSHHSAAAVWDRPVSGRWPARVDVTATDSGWSKSGQGVRVHRCLISPSEWGLRAGLAATSPTRTVFDLARSGDADDALVALDAALRTERSGGDPLATRDVLAGMIAAAPSSRVLAMARSVPDFADPDAGSAGESRSRIAICRAGLERLLLQVRHASARRAYYETDFEWPWRRAQTARGSDERREHGPCQLRQYRGP